MKSLDALPVWAQRAGLDATTWPLVNERLEAGVQPVDVRAEFKIPAGQRRSFDLYAHRFRAKRVISPINQVFAQVAQGMLALGPRFIRLLDMAMEQGLNNPTRTQRAATTMTQLFARILEIGVRLEEAKARQAEAKGEPKQSVDGNEAVRRMLDEYRISRCADAAGGNGRQGGNGRSITS